MSSAGPSSSTSTPPTTAVAALPVSLPDDLMAGIQAAAQAAARAAVLDALARLPPSSAPTSSAPGQFSLSFPPVKPRTGQGVTPPIIINEVRLALSQPRPRLLLASAASCAHPAGQSGINAAEAVPAALSIYLLLSFPSLSLALFFVFSLPSPLSSLSLSPSPLSLSPSPLSLSPLSPSISLSHRYSPLLCDFIGRSIAGCCHLLRPQAAFICGACLQHQGCTCLSLQHRSRSTAPPVTVYSRWSEVTYPPLLVEHAAAWVGCPSRSGPPPITVRAAAHHDQGCHPSWPGPPPITTRAAAHHDQGRRLSRPGPPPITTSAAAHHDQGRRPSRPGLPPFLARAAAHHDQGHRPSRPGPPPITTRAAAHHGQGCPRLGPGFQVGPLLPIVEPVRTYYLDPEPTSGLPLGTTGATGPSLPRLPQCGAWLITVG